MGAENEKGYSVTWKDDATDSVVTNVTTNIANLVPVLTPIEYTITYNLGNRFSLSMNPSTYNIESEFFINER